MRNSDDFLTNHGNIPDYPDYYITSCGRVWSFKRNKFLSPKNNGKGYLFVTLYNENGKKNFYLHRLVAEVYLSNPENKPQINHIDACKENNCVNNLEFVTHLENMKHAHDTGLLKTRKVCCIETGEIFNSVNDAARAVERDRTSMSRCLRGKYKTCGKYHWEYYEEE